MIITFDQLALWIQGAFAAVIALISINTGGTCGSHALVALIVLVVWGNRSPGRVRRNYSAVKVKAARLVKRD